MKFKRELSEQTSLKDLPATKYKSSPSIKVKIKLKLMRTKNLFATQNWNPFGQVSIIIT